jgi:hypothetical protein
MYGRGAMKLARMKEGKARYRRKYEGLGLDAINVAEESKLALNGASGKLP